MRAPAVPPLLIRPTRDADLLGVGEMDAESLRVNAIRIEDPYGGQRVEMTARLGKARIRVQVDVGIGDATVPEPQWIEYPSLLALPRLRLKAYRPETAIAEKLHAMVVLGGANSRMKDFFDVFVLASRRSFERGVLAEAIANTFARRATEVPGEPPIALTHEFASIPGKRAQWDGLSRRTGVSTDGRPRDRRPAGAPRGPSGRRSAWRACASGDRSDALVGPTPAPNVPARGRVSG